MENSPLKFLDNDVAWMLSEYIRNSREEESRKFHHKIYRCDYLDKNLIENKRIIDIMLKKITKRRNGIIDIMNNALHVGLNNTLYNKLYLNPTPVNSYYDIYGKGELHCWPMGYPSIYFWYVPEYQYRKKFVNPDSFVHNFIQNFEEELEKWYDADYEYCKIGIRSKT